MVAGEGLFVASRLTFRAVACGNVLSLALESNLNRRFLPFPTSANLAEICRGYHITVVNNGGGGRIRTFEVDDGRFTVCSLWPLGNPTTGQCLILACFLLGKRGASYQMMRPCKAFR